MRKQSYTADEVKASSARMRKFRDARADGESPYYDHGDFCSDWSQYQLDCDCLVLEYLRLQDEGKI